MPKTFQRAVAKVLPDAQPHVRLRLFSNLMLVPEHASAEDTIFLSALLKALRERAEAFARDVVAPALADIGSFELTAMLAQIRSTGGIRIKRGQLQ